MGQANQANLHWDSAQEGSELIAEGLYDEAAIELEQLIVRQPRNEYAYYFLGCAHFERARYAKALPAFVKALEIVPGYVGAMLRLGHTLRMLGHHDHAIRLGAQVLAREPEDADALFLIGACHFARGDREPATGFLLRFLATNPEVEAVSEAHGMLESLRAGDPTDASDERPD